MASNGKLVTVGVGGRGEGVSVGVEAVIVAEDPCVGGTLEGWLVTEVAVPAVLQAARERMVKPNNRYKDDLFIIHSS
jgi:hypothetical protein